MLARSLVLAESTESLLAILLAGRSLDRHQSRSLFEEIVSGRLPETILAAAIVAMKIRGETVDELVGAAQALLATATPFPNSPCDSVDIVGTGGDGLNTLNISTLAAITAATCDVSIAKHGNRSISSISGSFDFLTSLGLDINQTPEVASQSLREHGICFLFAPNYHSGLRHASAVRKELKTRTIFNLLGPLVNPARPKSMLLGVAQPVLIKKMAEAMSELGCQNVAVVHGSGLDEVAIHGPTDVVLVSARAISELQYTPGDFGLPVFALDHLVCTDAVESHARSRRVLSGDGSDAENAAVAVNVALAMSLVGKTDLKSNTAQAIASLKNGEPMKLVRRMTGKEA